MVWRLWINGQDSLSEISQWSIDDIVKANLLLNYTESVKKEAEQRQKHRK